jgi:hypothetical protein
MEVPRGTFDVVTAISWVTCAFWKRETEIVFDDGKGFVTVSCVATFGHVCHRGDDADIVIRNRYDDSVDHLASCHVRATSADAFQDHVRRF